MVSIVGSDKFITRRHDPASILRIKVVTRFHLLLYGFIVISCLDYLFLQFIRDLIARSERDDGKADAG